MGIVEKIRRHAAVASGNFASMFQDLEIPPLPAAAARLIAEVNQPEPDPGRLVKVISSVPELSAKVLRTVNSSFFSLPNRVITVRHAMVLLGLRRIRSIALSYSMVGAIPRPDGDLFDHEAFLTDSLVRALLARSFAGRHNKGEAEEAFTAMLLADVALPVLLRAWREYYAPAIERWLEGTERLSTIERREFQWDHSQAGAWILKSWGFPDEMVCYVGAHNLSLEEIRELELEETVAFPMAVASLTPSVLRPDPERARRMISTAADMFSMTETSLKELITDVRAYLAEVQGLFGLKDRNASKMLDDILAPSSPQPVGGSRE